MCPVHNPGKDEKRIYERLRLTTFRLRVFVWNAADESAEGNGFCFVSDFSNSGAGFYLNEKLPAGATVRVAFETEQSTTYRAVVMWSNRISFNQNFFGHESLAFRMGVRFLFGSEAERQRYLKFLEELRARVLVVEPGLKF